MPRIFAMDRPSPSAALVAACSSHAYSLAFRRACRATGVPAAARSREHPVILDPDQSAALREKLLTEVGSITSAELATAWAREALAAKNRLTAADAKLVEDAFERRLSELPSAETEAAPDD